MSITVDEQETSISYLRSENSMIIYTSDSTQMTLLDKKVKNYPGTWSILNVIKDQKGDVVAKEYKAPKQMLTFRNEKSHRTGNPNAGEGLRKWRENRKKEKEFSV
jgi:predicted double-glycine peptidase